MVSDPLTIVATDRAGDIALVDAGIAIAVDYRAVQSGRRGQRAIPDPVTHEEMVVASVDSARQAGIAHPLVANTVLGIVLRGIAARSAGEIGTCKRGCTIAVVEGRQPLPLGIHIPGGGVLARDHRLERIDDLHDPHRAIAGVDVAKLQLGVGQVVDGDLSVTVIDPDVAERIGTDHTALDIDETAARSIDVIRHDALVDEVVFRANQRTAIAGQVADRNIDQACAGMTGAVVGRQPAVEAAANGQRTRGRLAAGNGGVDIDVLGLNTDLTTDDLLTALTPGQVGTFVAHRPFLERQDRHDRDGGTGIGNTVELYRGARVRVCRTSRTVAAGTQRGRQAAAEQDDALAAIIAARRLVEQATVVVGQCTAAVNGIGNQRNRGVGRPGAHVGKTGPLGEWIAAHSPVFARLEYRHRAFWHFHQNLLTVGRAKLPERALGVADVNQATEVEQVIGQENSGAVAGVTRAAGVGIADQ